MKDFEFAFTIKQMNPKQREEHLKVLLQIWNNICLTARKEQHALLDVLSEVMVGLL
jgi:hypothetical protein